MDGSSLIFCGIEFQIVGAANLKALRPTALAVKGTCNRLRQNGSRQAEKFSEQCHDMYSANGYSLYNSTARSDITRASFDAR